MARVPDVWNVIAQLHDVAAVFEDKQRRDSMTRPQWSARFQKVCNGQDSLLSFVRPLAKVGNESLVIMIEAVIRPSAKGKHPTSVNDVQFQWLKGMPDARLLEAEWVDPKYHWKPLPVSEMPERLLIDYATRCNLRCHMCPVWGLEDDNAIDNVKGIMNVDAARRMLDEFISEQPMVAPSIYGEPLLIPNLREVITDLKRRGIAVAMNTNGLTLTEDIAAFFATSASIW